MEDTLKSVSTSDSDMPTLSPADKEQHLRTYLHRLLWNLFTIMPNYLRMCNVRISFCEERTRNEKRITFVREI